jgi:hypothetical protein
MITSRDTLGFFSSVVFMISGALFWYVSKHVLFMYPAWNLAYGMPALAGFLLAIAGIAGAFRKKRFPIFAGVGLIANAAALGFMVFAFALGAGH